MSYQSGRHFLQIPGPTNVPDRILLAMAQPTIDHRGPDFAELGLDVLSGLKGIFKTEHPVVIFPASGTGAWEAALVNTLSPGDKVLMFETGQFATLWLRVAERLGLDAELVSGDWRSGVDAAAVVVGSLRNRLETEASVERNGRVVIAADLKHHGVPPPGRRPIQATGEQFDGQAAPTRCGRHHDPIEISDVKAVECRSGSDLIIPSN